MANVKIATNTVFLNTTSFAESLESILQKVDCKIERCRFNNFNLRQVYISFPDEELEMCINEVPENVEGSELPDVQMVIYSNEFDEYVKFISTLGLKGFEFKGVDKISDPLHGNCYKVIHPSGGLNGGAIELVFIDEDSYINSILEKVGSKEPESISLDRIIALEELMHSYS